MEPSGTAELVAMRDRSGRVCGLDDPLDATTIGASHCPRAYYDDRAGSKRTAEVGARLSD